MSKLKVGIVGCGKIAQIRHIPEYYFHKEVEIIAVCDADIERAKQVSQEYKIPLVYTDFRELIDQSNVDAISICTPNVTHAMITIYALREGKHVLVEKPMATTHKDCELMVKEAERSGAVLLVGHNQRFSPLHQNVKEIIDSGLVGDIYQFSTNYHHGGPEHWSVDGENSWFFKREEAGLGVVADLGIHKVDLIQWLLNQKISEIKGYHSSFQKGGSVEDNAVLLLRLMKGTIGTVSLSWNNPLQDHRTVLYGEKGILTLGETLSTFKVEFYDGKKIEREVKSHLRPDGYVSSGIIEHFVACVQKKEEPLITAREAMHSIIMLEKGLKN